MGGTRLSPSFYLLRDPLLFHILPFGRAYSMICINKTFSLISLSALFLCSMNTLFAGNKAEKHPSPRPNIILFLVDDMGWQDSSVPFWAEEDGVAKKTFLNKRYKTPHMEKLASKGMMFTSAYAQPVCSPSRVSLMTGMNSARHRVTNWTLNCDQSTDAGNKNLLPAQGWNVNGLQPVGTPPRGKTKLPITNREVEYEMKKPYLTAHTLPELLRKSGYITIHCGKAHFGTRNTPGANPENLGFDYNIAGTEIGGPADYRGSKKYGQGPFAIRGLDENNYYENDIFLTEALTQEAIKRLELIRNSSDEAGQPFYLYMSHYAIHAPFDQRGYDQRFADNYKDPQDGNPWSDNERRYAGLIEGMDKSLGDLMTYLEEKDLSGNTIILFMSDNGGLAISGRMGNELSNYPLSFGKGSTREGGIREPMIVSWPGVTKSGAKCDAPIIIEDFFPSILEMAGATNFEPHQKVDGVSFVPLLRGSTQTKDRPLLFHFPNIWGEGSSFSQYYQPSTALRLGDWKLIYWHAEQMLELFHLKEDISEQRNLASALPKKTREMAELMTSLLKKRNAQMPVFKKGNSLQIPPDSPAPWPDKILPKNINSARKQ